MKLVLAKIGGSVLTEKQGFCTLRPQVMTRLATEIATFLKTNEGYNLTLIHGVGSFGHAPYARYNLGSKNYTHKEWMGFAFTRWACNDLSQKMVQSLLEHGVPAVGMEGVGHMPTRTTDTDSFNIQSIKRALEEGLVPVLHGNMAFGSGSNPASAFSGDKKLGILAAELAPERVVIGTDVDGIYDKDPKTPGAKLITHLTYEELTSMLPNLGPANFDATGGMKGKITELLEVKRQGLPVKVVNALQEGRFGEALAGKNTPGTLIE